jgi:hypothetical protein
MKKRTDAQLFKELRIIVLIIGVAMIIVFLATTFVFTEPLGDYWYKFVLLALGFLLIIYSLQKDLQENPKAMKIVMWILLILALLGIVVLLIVL